MRPKTVSRKRSPQKPPSQEAFYEIAVRALARRARSSGEVREILRKKKAAKADIEAVIARLREYGYLDDARFARAFVASRMENDLHGKARVRRDLAAHRVHPEIAEQAVERGYQGTDETQLLRRYLARKVRLSKPLDKPSHLASLYRRLLRAGFRSATIVAELKRLRRWAFSKGSAEPFPWDEFFDSLPETPEEESEAG